MTATAADLEHLLVDFQKPFFPTIHQMIIQQTSKFVKE
jgi:hypothetical protein